MRPSSYPKGWNKEASKTQNHSMVMQLWTINGKCPKNSIPIIRTRRENILQAESVERYGRKDPNSLPQPKPTNPPSNTTNEVCVQWKYTLKNPSFSLIHIIYAFVIIYMFMYI